MILDTGFYLLEYQKEGMAKTQSKDSDNKNDFSKFRHLEGEQIVKGPTAEKKDDNDEKDAE